MNGDVPNFEDAVEKLLVREVREEAGIEVKGPLHYINSVVFIRPDNIPVVLIKFAVRYKSGEIALEDAFTDYAWVNAEEVKQYDCVEGITEEVVRTIVMFQHA
jgi:NADH pyrophosphatase NudC (nudix superfamily)